MKCRPYLPGSLCAAACGLQGGAVTGLEAQSHGETGNWAVHALLKILDVFFFLTTWSPEHSGQKRPGKAPGNHISAAQTSGQDQPVCHGAPPRDNMLEEPHCTHGLTTESGEAGLASPISGQGFSNSPSL